MSLKAMSDYTFVSKYARYLKDKRRRETWDEAVDRVRDMHVRRYPGVREHIDWAFEQVRSKRVLGSQRALQFGGEPMERKHARGFNCTSSYCDRMRFFQEAFWLLLCGSGVGFSVQHHHVSKLGGFHEGVREAAGSRRTPGSWVLPGGERAFVVPDSIEGWADALGVLLATFLPHPEFPGWAGYEAAFDYSEIRPKGSPLASGVGKAPGPEPLRRALEVIRGLLKKRVACGHLRLRPVDCYDVLMHASDAVLSGGVRRSATICLFSPEDEEMLKAKTGNWFNENPQRARSNNSVLLIRGETSKEEFLRIMESVKEFGEPGFVWSDDRESLFNPCSEVNMRAIWDETGETGFQGCNLCEINGSMVKSAGDWRVAARAAAIIGTLQAGYTDFPYLGRVTEEIFRKESLLGVSITGVMDSPDVLLDPVLQREMARVVVDVNEWFAGLIGVNPAARCTTLKPAGTTSCLLGTASGIHAHHARRYIRHMQGNELETPLQHFALYNPHACEASVWSANKTDKVIAFCVNTPESAKTKKEVDAISLLGHVKTTQENWIAAGKVAERCTAPWLQNNVSNTVNVRPHEWGAVADFIYDNRGSFAGVSLLPSTGDLDYPQAPMVAVRDPEEIADDYGDCLAEAARLVRDGLAAFDNDLWAACEAVLDPPPGDSARRAWADEAGRFAWACLGGDLKKATYLLKELYYLRKWKDLNLGYQDVDYETMIEETDGTRAAENWACAGGRCEL